jgi:hypothetical protein
MISRRKTACGTCRPLKQGRGPAAWAFALVQCAAGLVILSEAGAVAQVYILQPPGIGFSNLNGTNGAAYVGHTEGSFAVTVTSGSWFQSQVYGNPNPSIFLGPLNSPGVGVLQITDGAGPFTLSSFSFSSNNGDSLYDIRGFLGSTLEYEETGTLAGTFGPFSFSSLAISNSSVAIDGLFIGLTPGSGVTSVNMDDIFVTTIPEPGSGLVMVAGVFVLTRCRPSHKGTKRPWASQA